MIVYADTGFLISLYGQDANSAAATALVKDKLVFILTPPGEAEFSNAVELRKFRKQWTPHEAQAVMTFCASWNLEVRRPRCGDGIDFADSRSLGSGLSSSHVTVKV